MDFCFVQQKGSKRGEPFCSLWTWGGVGGFGCDRTIFPVSLGFCVVLGSGLTVTDMSHFLVIGGLKRLLGKHACSELTPSFSWALHLSSRLLGEKKTPLKND